MERTWQIEGTSLQESSGCLLTETVQEAAADPRRQRTGDTPSAFFAMQRSVGNRAVQRMVAALRGEDRSPSRTPDSDPHDEMQMAQPECACGGSCSACQSRQGPEVKTALATKPSPDYLLGSPGGLQGHRDTAGLAKPVLACTRRGG